MTTSATTEPTTPSWAAAPSTCTAIFAIWFTYAMTTRAVTTTSTQAVIYETVAVIAMIAVTARASAEHNVWRRPHNPWLERRAWARRRPAGIVVVTIATTLLAAYAADIGVTELAAIIWPPNDGPTYNDPDVTGHSAGVALISTINAGIGEELLFRLALLAVTARYLPLPVAVTAQAVIFGLAHTGIDDGYSAASVTGLIAFGVVLGAVAIVTRSIWPAVIAHTYGNVVVVIAQYDLLDEMVVVAAAIVAAALVAAAIARIRNNPAQA